MASARTSAPGWLSVLIFVGLGLYDEHDVTVKGRLALEGADVVFAEFYTSSLTGTSVEQLEEFHGREIHVLSRSEVEDSDDIVRRAAHEDVVFAVGGDPMVSTTHAELRLRAFERGIDTRVVNAPSASSAVCSATGLQNYRFGRSTSLVQRGGWTPESPYEVVEANLERGLHTLVYLDVDVDEDGERYMTASEGADALASMGEAVDLVVGVARLGSERPHVFGGPPERVADHDFGPPLHILVVPGELHEVERQYLETMANVNFDSDQT